MEIPTSRLDSAIRRLEAQRACLDHVAGLIRDREGLVIELGLGNGRTYDHLREKLGGRRILVFERSVNPHAASMPVASDLVIGDLSATLPDAGRRLRQMASLIHSDIGCGNPEIDRATAALVAEEAANLLAERGWIISDQALTHRTLEEQPLPAGVLDGRYFLYRRQERS